MAVYKIPGDFCVICRYENFKDDTVPCESEVGICLPVTRLDPADEEWSMDAGVENEFVIAAWEEIRSISRREKVEIQRRSGGKTETLVLYLPTLEKLEVWIEMQDWDTAPLDRQEFFRRLMLFHNKYIEMISKV